MRLPVTEKDVEKLLETGWIYSIVQRENKEDDAYFYDGFFRHIPEEERFRYGRGWFLKKSETLFKRFVSMGMPVDSDAYDSCVILILTKQDKIIKTNLLSLKEESNIEKVAKAIFLEEERKQSRKG